jgi:hypothetical protein
MSQIVRRTAREPRIQLLRHLWKLRELRTHVIPWLRAGSKDIHRWFVDAGIVQARDIDDYHAGHDTGLGEKRRSAVDAEAATDGLATPTDHFVILDVAGNFDGVLRHSDIGRIRTSASPLTVATMTIAHESGIT